MMNICKNYKFSISELLKLYFKEKCCRHMSCSSPCAKRNDAFDYCHTVMRSKPAYKLTTIDPTSQIQNFETLNRESSQEAKLFLAMCNEKHPRTDVAAFRCRKYFNDIENKISINDMKYILLWFFNQKIFDNAILPLYEQFNILCLKRIHLLNYDELLLMADIWFHLGLGRSDFNYNAAKLLSKKVMSIQPYQFVQCMFIMALTQSYLTVNQKIYFKRKLLKKCELIINEITIEELGIVALAFYRNGIIIDKSYLLAIFFENLGNSLPHVSDVTIGNFCEMFKCSVKEYDENHYGLCSRLQSRLLQYHNTKMDATYFYAHAISLGNEILYIDKELLDGACENVVRYSELVKSNDVAMILHAILNYNHIPLKYPNFLIDICNVLHKKNVAENIFYLDVPVYYLSCLQLFEVDLICKVFQNFLQSSKGTHDLLAYEHVFWLNDMVKFENIEIPANLQIPASTVTYFHQAQHQTRIEGIKNRRAFIVDVFSIFAQIFGIKDYCSLAIILPFEFGPNLVFCTNEEGIPVPVPQEYKTESIENVKLPVDCDRLNWHAIVLANYKCTVNPTNELLGSISVHNRYKEKFNYRTSFVAERIMNKMTTKEKILYVCSVIRPFVSEKWLTIAENSALEAVNNMCQPTNITDTLEEILIDSKMTLSHNERCMEMFDKKLSC